MTDINEKRADIENIYNMLQNIPALSPQDKNERIYEMDLKDMSIHDLAALSDLYKLPPWLTYALEERKKSVNLKGGGKRTRRRKSKNKRSKKLKKRSKS